MTTHDTKCRSGTYYQVGNYGDYVPHPCTCSPENPAGPIDAPKDRTTEIRAREEAATVGPWSWVNRDSARPYLAHGPQQGVLGCAALLGPEPADAEFIAHAREDIPFLLDQLEQARTDLAAAEEARQAWAATAQQQLAEVRTESEKRREVILSMSKELAHRDAAIGRAVAVGEDPADPGYNEALHAVKQHLRGLVPDAD